MPSDRIASPTQLRLHEEHLERRKRMMAMPRLSPPKVVSPPKFHMEHIENLPAPLEVYGPPAPPPKRTVKWVLKTVAAKHGISVRDILGNARQYHIAAARHEACWRIRNEVKVSGKRMSLPMIGRALGRRDHTTVLNSIRKYEARLAQEHIENNGKCELIGFLSAKPGELCDSVAVTSPDFQRSDPSPQSGVRLPGRSLPRSTPALEALA